MEKAKKNYQRFQEQKTRLEEMLESSRKVFVGLDMMADEDKVGKLKIKVGSESFKVMIIGRFNVGKSTFINALLGKEVLPAYPIPCTAVINEVKYAEKRKAILYFRDPMPQKFPEGISQTSIDYIDRYKGQTPPPLEIPVDHLEDYVVIPKTGKEQADAIAETPYEKVELFWDLPLCRDGVEIIDSPGLDESYTRTNIAFNYLTKADAVIFIMGCESLCSLTEMNYIDEKILPLGHDYIFFVNNRINLLREKERGPVREFGNGKLAPKTTFRERGVFYINALGALDGRMEGDDKKLQESGILPLEELLADFLTNKKGKVKILQPSKDLITSVKKAMFEIIPFQRALLNNDYDVLKKNYEQNQPKLNNLETQKKHIVETLELKIDLAMDKVALEVRNQFTVINERIPVWIKEAPVTKEVSLKHAKESSKAVAEEIIEYMKSQLEKEQLTWTKQTLAPLLEKKTEEIIRDSSGKVEKFFVDLHRVKIELSNFDPDASGSKEMTNLEKFGAGAIGAYLGGAGGAYIGYQFGFSRTFFQQIAINIAGVLLLTFVGLFNPISFIILAAANLFFGLNFGREQIVGKIRAKIEEQVMKDFQANSGEMAQKLNTDVRAQLMKGTASVGNSLDKELQSVRTQIEQTLKEMETSGAAATTRKTRIDGYEQELKRVDQELDELILAIASQD